MAFLRARFSSVFRFQLSAIGPELRRKTLGSGGKNEKKIKEKKNKSNGSFRGFRVPLEKIL